MGNDSQNEERHSPSPSPGSGHDGNQPPPPADEGTHGEERPSGDHLQRMESNVQRPGSQYSASTEDEVVTAEIVEELTRRVDSYLWSAPAPSPETLEA